MLVKLRTNFIDNVIDYTQVPTSSWKHGDMFVNDIRLTYISTAPNNEREHKHYFKVVYSIFDLYYTVLTFIFLEQLKKFYLLYC